MAETSGHAELALNITASGKLTPKEKGADYKDRATTNDLPKYIALIRHYVGRFGGEIAGKKEEEKKEEEKKEDGGEKPNIVREEKVDPRKQNRMQGKKDLDGNHGDVKMP